MVYHDTTPDLPVPNADLLLASAVGTASRFWMTDVVAHEEASTFKRTTFDKS